MDAKVEPPNMDHQYLNLLTSAEVKGVRPSPVSRGNRSSKSKLVSTKSLLFICLIIFIIVVVVTFGVGLYVILDLTNKADQEVEIIKKTFKNESNICVSLDCVTTASYLMNSMDLTVDPCTDFYSFTCGNWIRNALASSDKSQFTILTSTVFFRVKDLLENTEKEVRTSNHQIKASAFYKACMNGENRKLLGAKELQSDLKKLGGWPLIENFWDPANFDWSKLIVDFFKLGYMNDMLFTVRVAEDMENTSKSLIKIDQPNVGFSKTFYYSFIFRDVHNLYKETMFRLAKKLNYNINDIKARIDIEQAFLIEKKVAALIKVFDRKHLDEFQNIYTLKQLNQFAPNIPWIKIFKGLLPPNTNLPENQRILVTVPSMIEGLNNILGESENLRALANYMFYRAVFYAAEDLSSDFHDIINQIRSNNLLSGWLKCVETTMDGFQHSLTASYARKYMKNESKDLLDVMVQDLKETLAEQVRESSWLDTTTKERALSKIEKMKKAVAYKDEIMNDAVLDKYYSNMHVSISHFSNMKNLVALKLGQNMQGLHDERKRFSWDKINSFLDANAHYYYEINSLIIPVGFLQNTIFTSGRPNYLNYGSLGTIVGHEMNHAFDSIGSKYDAYGKYQMWWTQETWEKFQDKTNCYKNQYSKYYMKSADAFIDGVLTLDENIADNGGIQAAYQAYEKLLTKLGSEKKLPGLPYNEKQMFWIAYASVWCRKQTEESIKHSMVHDEHTLSHYRVLGSLSNMKQFSEDFNCKVNTTMNPLQKCSLWT